MWSSDPQRTKGDTSLINQLAGKSDQTDVRYTGNNATTNATTGRIITAGEDSEASISDTAVNKFNLTLLDQAVATAKTATPLIRPFRVNGGEYYVCLVHPYQVYQLRTNTNTGQWADIQKAALQGGKIGDNPIFTGAKTIH